MELWWEEIAGLYSESESPPGDDLRYLISVRYGARVETALNRYFYSRNYGEPYTKIMERPITISMLKTIDLPKLMKVKNCGPCTMDRIYKMLEKWAGVETPDHLK